MESGFFNPYAPLRIHGRKLPHWQHSGALYFLTWRLADSVPSSMMRDLKFERDQWFRSRQLPLKAADELEYRRRFSLRMEEWLDRGMGSCVLRQAELREIVEDGIVERFEEVEVDSYVVMPNHVHAIVKVEGNRSLPHIVKAAKGRSANRLNRALG